MSDPRAQVDRLERVIRANPKRWMQRELVLDAESYMDCGEVNATKLVEAYADVMDHEDEEIPAEWWDAGAEVALEREGDPDGSA